MADTKDTKEVIPPSDDSETENEETTEEKTNAQKLNETFEERIKSLKDQITNLKKECAALEQLQKAVKKELSAKVPKKKRTGNTNSAFKLPVEISPELCKFLELEEGTKIPRTEVTKMLCKWVADHEIKDEKDKRVIDINCAEAAPLKKIMKRIPKADLKKFTCFTMQRYIQHHYVKAPEKKESSPAKKAKKTGGRASKKSEATTV
tara:strand:- start:112 stop:729 length:618 start_codon:yes stop_codon:yes gene_type:complete